MVLTPHSTEAYRVNTHTIMNIAQLLTDASNEEKTHSIVHSNRTNHVFFYIGSDISKDTQTTREFRRIRKFTPKEQEELDRVYKRTAYPSHDEREELATKFCTTSRRVQIWFQNRRQRAVERGRSTQVQPPQKVQHHRLIMLKPTKQGLVACRSYSSLEAGLNIATSTDGKFVITPVDGKALETSSPVTPSSVGRFRLSLTSTGGCFISAASEEDVSSARGSMTARRGESVTLDVQNHKGTIENANKLNRLSLEVQPPTQWQNPSTEGLMTARDAGTFASTNQQAPIQAKSTAG
ncbi:hypothetical protein PROFUN_11096 [Planoprotostelium fungivorum]|uniref:Homeobox domain-containing protein n=1 Tax=Planoprotostelium fungivorum TaxID=1890364 RepID=A0A2P6NAK8_9EUKA|nr:hypothetical protein PROFUN_11096 [Planoprotostelium fungivorum]